MLPEKGPESKKRFAHRATESTGKERAIGKLQPW
mgnify:CR=1 FL=1